MKAEDVVKIAETICKPCYYDRKAKLNEQLSAEAPDQAALVQEITTATYADTVANGANAGYRVSVAFVTAIRRLDTADNNENAMDWATTSCERMLNRLSDSGLFRRITNASGRKVEENEYTLGVIGWEVTFTLQPIAYNC